MTGFCDCMTMRFKGLFIKLRQTCNIPGISRQYLCMNNCNFDTVITIQRIVIKLRIILIVFAGVFLMVFCKKVFIKSDEVVANESTDDKSERDGSNGDETTGNESNGGTITGYEVPVGDSI